MSTPSAAPSEFRSDLHSVNMVRSGLRIVVCVALFTGLAVVEATRLTSLTDIDIWLHLRTGLWILQNHSLPHSILFSHVSGLPWAVPDWGFDLCLGLLYKLIGLRAIPIMFMIAKVLIALALFMLAKRGTGRVWPAVFLSGVAQFALSNVPSRPLVYGVLLFSIELLVLLDARRTGKWQGLLFLPVLFLVWANIDWHCYIGILTLMLFAATAAGERVWYKVNDHWNSSSRVVPVGIVGLVTVVSIAVLLLPPYSYHVFQVAYANTFSAVAVQHFPDLRSIPFRSPQDYITILFAMLAFFSLGRVRSQDVFKFALLAVCAFLGFRFQRETWMIVVASLAVLGDVVSMGEQVGPRQPLMARVITTAIVLVVFVVSGSSLPSRHKLLDHAAKALPVRACEFIRANHLPVPIFNAIQWGGFLSWELPDYPVVMDTRVDVYRDLMARYFAATQGAIPLNDYHAFVGARTILLEKGSPMATALVRFPNVRLEYQDDLAVVLVKQ